FGGVERFKEESRDERAMRGIENLLRDTAYGVRVLLKNPGFAIAVALTFALGIGCTSAIFSLVHGILLRPLPYDHPASLVSVWERNDARARDRNVVSVATLEAWQARARSFTRIAALIPRPLTLDGAPAERMKGVEVSPGYFAMLGVHPALGRDFAAADAVSQDAILLSSALWRSRFGGDSSIVGKRILMDGQPMIVVGVMGADFDPPRFGWIADQPLWLPFVATPEKKTWGRSLHLVARLAPGVSVEQAQSEIDELSRTLAVDLPGNAQWSGTVLPLSETITGDVRRPIVVSFAAVVLLLLMSMVNVANLMMAFLRRRAHELALRGVLGASAGRLVRQQVVLCALLGVVGTALGLAVAVVGTRALVHFAPPSVPRLSEVRIDGAVIALAAAVAVATIFIVGILGALRTGDSFGASLATAGSGRATVRMAGSRLLATEVAIGLVLTILASLMVRSLINLRAVPLGFDVTSMVTGRVSLPDVKYANDPSRRAFFDALLASIRSIPGVQGASLVTSRPFACCAPSTQVSDPTRALATESSPVTEVRFVDDSYFSTARIPIVAGSAFQRSESATGDVRVVVSRSLARMLWGDADPVGRPISIAIFGKTEGRVIGVVGDVRLDDVRAPVKPSAYLSTVRFPSSERDIVVRGRGDMGALIAAVQRAIASIDESIPFYKATTIESSVAETLAQDRFTTFLLSAFAIVSLLLAAIGTYGVMSGDVTRRRKEIGIRIALGARRVEVTTLVLSRALRAAVIGAAIGVLAALAIARTMTALVYGVAPWDPASFIWVTGALLLIAGLSTLAPAIRATRVSPMESIRTN
ncbi:MAG: ABC transporter permease, partial [Gemmatimonadota bacterium]|nr:ABC transporter permease [Gemmatimonadota bacterium]